MDLHEARYGRLACVMVLTALDMAPLRLRNCCLPAQLTVERLIVGPLMTALDMKGFSLTLLEVDDGRLELLDAPTEVQCMHLVEHLQAGYGCQISCATLSHTPKRLDAEKRAVIAAQIRQGTQHVSCTYLVVWRAHMSYDVTQAPGWPQSSSVCHRDKELIPVPTGPIEASQPSATVRTAADGEATPSGQLLGSCIEAAADALIANAARLDELDRAVGDGDCGSTLATAARAIKQVLLDRKTSTSNLTKS